ncbi:hypothetical protein D8674_035664 [Pyrus ussuriensis x Pyrus communis]|uniref:Proteasome alpha-type subunits domain-containing protein n=1 Tax=Pyrus ussuriensis x Pyrus communis TaxID=2448454 RepID=A0A5N5GDH9_9ROSA|nr:hypothetical protein D8674_035664 [Pyrus ussuriensis x Pyrus communis]
MSWRYDSRTTIFSPEGRLYQVGYAMEAIGNAGTAIGILSKDGVVLVAKYNSLHIRNRCLWSSLFKLFVIPSRGTRSLVVSGHLVFRFQLYMSDPSGNYAGWKAAGANNQAAQSMLKQDYKDDMTRKVGVELALKVLSKTMDSTSLTPEKLELAEVFVYITSNGS